MSSVFQKALRLLIGIETTLPSIKLSKKRPLRDLTERELILLESEIGAKLFGPVMSGGRREFFNEDKTNWIWHEEWLDDSGKIISMTTRYEVQPQGILKVRLGEPYHYIDGEELRNLNLATQMYYEQVMRHVYKRDPKTGKRLDQLV